MGGPRFAQLRSAVVRYAFALAMTAATVLATAAAAPALGGPYFFFAFPAALLAGIVGGTGPGLLFVGSYVAVAGLYFVPPGGSISLEGPSALRLLLVAASLLLVAAGAGRLRTALRRERRLRDDARHEIAARARAEEELRRANGQLAALQGLTAAFSAARTSDEVAKAMLERGLPLLGARAGSICFQTADDRLAIRFSEAFDDEVRRSYAFVPLDAPLPTTEAARTGRGVWLSSAAEIDRRYPHLREVRARSGDRAWACLPLRVEGEPGGVLGLSYREERAFDALERAFIASVEQLCAQAFSRARRHEAEQEARARAEAAEDAARRASALQDQVLAVVGHDLRTPLAAITMALGLVRRGGVADERLASALERIGRSAHRMNEIIRDLLDLARARQGIGMTLSRRRLSAREVCAQAIAELEQVHPGRAVCLGASGDAWVEADGSRLHQAISNLVGNALQHGPDDTIVAVEVAGEAASGVRIRVRNGGPPIPAPLLDALFEPFRRGDGAGDAGGSLGLGLFIVREIARAHGGSVAVSSDAEVGTVFELWLPRGAHLPADPAEGPPAAAGEVVTPAAAGEGVTWSHR